MENKTLDELRALARAAGVRGYSNLRKKQLIELLNKQKARSSETPATPARVVRAPKKRAKSSVKPHPTNAATAVPAFAAKPTNANELAATEQHIESAKYEMTPPGVARAPQVFRSSNLDESIEQLPAPGESVLCLLPQKPGVVHAYWILQPGALPKDLRLRLCCSSADAIALLEEVNITSMRGHWYFQVAREAGELVAQLGSYDANGAFVTAMRRGIARIPSLYAANESDRRWWISDAEFREMYLRAGGTMRDKRLLWPGSFSSRHK